MTWKGMLLYGCPWWDAGGLCHHADCSQVLCISCVAEGKSLVSSSIQRGNNLIKIVLIMKWSGADIP